MRVNLWAVHIEGPDDILAMVSREAAEKYAADLNMRLDGQYVPHFEPDMHAEVVPWPYSAESHAAELRKGEPR